MTDDPLPAAEDIIAAHDEIEEEYDLKYKGARVPAPRLKFREIVREAAEYDDDYMRGAFLLRKIITSHYFEDANKRTGWAVARDYFNESDSPIENTDVSVERVLRSIRRYGVDEIATWLRSGEIDRDRLNPPRSDKD